MSETDLEGSEDIPYRTRKEIATLAVSKIEFIQEIVRLKPNFDRLTGALERKPVTQPTVDDRIRIDSPL